MDLDTAIRHALDGRSVWFKNKPQEVEAAQQAWRDARADLDAVDGLGRILACDRGAHAEAWNGWRRAERRYREAVAAAMRAGHPFEMAPF